MVFESLLNPIFSPLLGLDPVLSILLISLLISIIITIVYKYVTDQDLMKRLKDEMKSLQKEIKELKDNPEKAMKVQKQAMETNMKYMMNSMKPTLFTMLPIILIFGWLNAHMGYYPILPGQEFTATIEFDKGSTGTIELLTDLQIIGESVKNIENGTAIFTMKGPKGEYLLDFKKDGKVYSKEVLITQERDYSKVEEIIKEDGIKSIKLSNSAVKPFRNFSLFGWKPGWLGTYIIFSIIFSSLLRKLMKIY